MITVDELDGFHPGDQVILRVVYPPYEQRLVGRVGTIEKIAGANKLDSRISIRVPGERLLVSCNADQIEHIIGGV